MEPESSVSLTEINPIDVYEVLESRKFVDKLLNGMLQDIKNSTAYTDLKEIAICHFASIETGKNDEPIERKKKQTYDVGYLSDCIASTLTKTLHEKLLALQNDIYATSKAVIEELEMKISDNEEMKYSETSLSKQNGSHIIYSSTPNKRNRKRCIEENTGETSLKESKVGSHLTADIQSKSTVQSNVKNKC
ncbi:uncharacterized protein [Parasteatoda tepidariorum]|uniref:uncharacterized protein isoform X2 n=1 Tax=Parasteatoda tepidariorum TaxID=114398 RepID=UPI0039BC822A